MTTGQKIQALRNSKNLTQYDLEAALLKKYPACGITRADIANWELDRHQPHWPKAKVLVQFFKITLDELFFENKKLAIDKAKSLKVA